MYLRTDGRVLNMDKMAALYLSINHERNTGKIKAMFDIGGSEAWETTILDFKDYPTIDIESAYEILDDLAHALCPETVNIREIAFKYLPKGEGEEIPF